jgi:malonyl-CoA/methylmalonyl-CoA synthetase
MSANFYQAIEQALSKTPEKEIIKSTVEGAITTEQLLQSVSRMTHALIDIGVKPGDRVSVQVEKSLANVYLYLATLKIGAVYLPLNTAYTDSEIEYFLSDATPTLHVCTSARESGAQAIASKLENVTVKTLDVATGSLWQQFEATSIDAEHTETVPRDSDDLAVILYTSGTTGRPKGAMITHSNLLSNANMLTEAWQYSDKDSLLHALPLFHIHGLFVALNLSLVNNAQIFLLPKFDPQLVLETLPEATVMMGVPTFYVRLLGSGQLTPENCAHMRLFISGSAPLLVETSEAFFKASGHRILERYGMTETGMSCSNPLNGDRRAGTVGPALPGVEARVVGDDGQPVAAGIVGTLEVRGPHVFKGYWKLPEKTASEFRDDGFFITGDLATLSEDGYVSIVGRGKDLIITGGLNVYPKEIEDEINQFDGVDESAVIGVKHPDFGEGIIAVVVASADLDLDGLKAQCKKDLAGFKNPKGWYVVDALPRNTMGKVQKNLLREQYANEFC